MPSIPAINKNTIEDTAKIDFIEKINLKNMNYGSPLVWEPGLILEIFFKVIELFIDYIVNEGWFPGLSLIFMYLFLVLVVLGILFNNPE